MYLDLYLRIFLQDLFLQSYHGLAYTRENGAVPVSKICKTILPIASVRTLYTSIVELHFRYCCSVWGCCSVTTINQLEKLQNRAARILTESIFNAHSGPIIKSLSWKTIRELVDEESKLIVYKSINGLAP